MQPRGTESVDERDDRYEGDGMRRALPFLGLVLLLGACAAPPGPEYAYYQRDYRGPGYYYYGPGYYHYYYYTPGYSAAPGNPYDVPDVQRGFTPG